MQHPALLVVNFKNYRIGMEDTMNFIQEAVSLSERYKTTIALAPPHHMLGAAAATVAMSHVIDMVKERNVQGAADADGPPPAGGRNVAVMAQHVDVRAPGSATGFVVPELLSDAGIAGSIINHSERRVKPNHIAEAVLRLRGLGMTSIVCTRSVRESGRYANLDPDYIAIEPPELIGSGRSVSTQRPELIRDAAAAVKDAGTSTRLLCGAGITSGDDVSRAVSLGSAGILVASGVVSSPDPARALGRMAAAMPNS